MNDRVRAGQLLIIGFEGPVAPPEVLRRIAERRIAGVVLFNRNLGTPAEIAALTRSLQGATPAGDPPLVISIDQEGGRVQRIKAPLTVWPPMARVGAQGDEALSEKVGAALGAELAALGFNVDYAPVLDVRTNPVNEVIGDRAFATTPQPAAQHALAFWRGLEKSGVRGCGKHYPGHGDTVADSHLELPRVDHDEVRLRAVELAPFVAAAHANVPMMMTAHVVYPAIDPLPATLSRRWLTEILRGELGYRGVILTDDLDMKAVAAHFPVEETVTKSLIAGADAFLACRDPEIQARAETALDDAAARDANVRTRVVESAERMHAFRATLRGAPASTSVDASMLADHGTLAARLRV
jgi:beta-N-acetylhexosaminidase